jgi:hypothetical protein
VPGQVVELSVLDIKYVLDPSDALIEAEFPEVSENDPLDAQVVLSNEEPALLQLIPPSNEYSNVIGRPIPVNLPYIVTVTIGLYLIQTLKKDI